VSFSASPSAARKGASKPGTETSEYVYESGTYGERAACTCKVDIDYSKLTQFDAVGYTRRTVEKRGFTLEKAVFDETPETGRELHYQASDQHDSNHSFLVGRNLYGECGLTVTATGTTYADFLRAEKFLASVSSGLEPKEKSVGAGDDATITTAGETEKPRKSKEASVTEPQAASRTSTTPATAQGNATTTATAPNTTTTPPAAAGASPAAAPPAVAATVSPNEKQAKAGPPPPTVRLQAQASADHPITPAPTATVAARLRQLNELLNQKLITKAEYDERRRAILDSL
jgi:hypothetical protein